MDFVDQKKIIRDNFLLKRETCGNLIVSANLAQSVLGQSFLGGLAPNFIVISFFKVLI